VSRMTGVLSTRLLVVRSGPSMGIHDR
jgi:hypothetical protein